MPCQNDNVDEGYTLSDDPKNPKARNVALHPAVVPVYQKWNGQTSKSKQISVCPVSLPNLRDILEK